jgi:hypothetical protein
VYVVNLVFSKIKVGVLVEWNLVVTTDNDVWVGVGVANAVRVLVGNRMFSRVEGAVLVGWTSVDKSFDEQADNHRADKSR